MERIEVAACHHRELSRGIDATCRPHRRVSAEQNQDRL